MLVNQNEIEQAITAFITSQIQVADNQEISIELRAGRGPEGFTASLDINPRSEAQPAPTAPVAITEPAKAQIKAELQETATKIAATMAPKRTLGLSAKPKVAPEPEPEVEAKAEAKQAYTGEDDGAEDEVQNTMTGDRPEEEPMNEAAAPAPRSIFSKRA